MRLFNGVLAFLAVVVCAGLFLLSFAYFKGQQIDEAAARLTLYRTTLESEIRHFRHLPVHLSLDAEVAEGLTAPEDQGLNRRLARFAQSAGLDAIYLMDGTGLTISASNASTPASFLGQNYAFRPYFKAARQGELGEFYGIGATTGEPGYFYAFRVRHPAGGADGVIAVKTDLSPLQESWEASGERVFLANGDGVVLLSSHPSWRFRTLSALSPEQRETINAARQFADEPLDQLDLTVDLVGQTARLDGETYFYQRTGELPNNWSLHYFAPRGPAVLGAGLVSGGFVIFAMVSLIAIQFARNRRIGFALERSEKEELLLRQANEKLAVEIEERRLAERALQRTQAELERAGRLAALGQLASFVTHELGQPIAAMRNHLTAAEIKQGRTPLGDKMQGLVIRMENITKQLKFFSRKGRDQFETLDLHEVLDAALELIEPNVTQIGARVQVQRSDDALTLTGNKLRLEQVATNLLRNALDAVQEAEIRQITVTLGAENGDVWFEIADTGHGLGDQSFDDLREPFATTRESGQGMGLGLTISAGIVTDHGGTISAKDRPGGGAQFRVTLPKDPERGPP